MGQDMLFFFHERARKINIWSYEATSHTRGPDRYPVYVSTPLMVLGLANDWLFMTTSVSWALYVFGTMITTVAVASYYLLDSYPEASGEVSACINCGRATVGFVISYLQVEWAKRQGTRASFGMQAAIMALSFLVVLVVLRYGKQLRMWSGPLDFRTA